MGEGSTELRGLRAVVQGMGSDLAALERSVERLYKLGRSLEERIRALEAAAGEGPSETKKRVSKTRRVAAGRKGKG